MSEPIKPTVLPEDWPEDFAHENGCYMNRCCVCSREFRGHKRRATCKACTVTKPIKLPPDLLAVTLVREGVNKHRARDIEQWMNEKMAQAVEQATVELRAEVERLRAELARLTTLRPASAPRPAKVLLWDKHGEFAGHHVQQARMPDSWFWTPIPTPEEADK